MNPLNTLLFVYSSVLGLNSLIAALLWNHYKSRIFALAFAVWVFSALNFFLQGIFQSSDIWMALSFLTYFPVALSLALIYKEMRPEQYVPTRSYFTAAVGGTALTVVTSFLDFPFMLTALIAATIIAYPMLDMGIRGIKTSSKDSALLKIYSSLLILNAIHFLDYPLLRNYEAATLFGFSLVLLIIFAFSILIPIIALRLNDQQHARSLEAKVCERTKALEVANQQLQEALSQNENLLNIVCHDIASPLMIAKLNIEKLLLKTSDSSDDLRAVSKSLQKIKLSTLTMQEVLEQVRKLHILDIQHAQMDLAPVDIRQSIFEVFKLLEDRMEEKSLGLEIISEVEKPYFVKAEKSILQNNVFLNLVTNAIKFSHPGGNIQVRIGEENDYVTIAIKDEGIGIPKEIQSKIFEIKSKTSRYGTKGEVGTGLGLPIVKRCLDQFSATIHCQSADDDSSALRPRGTEFEIRFPKAS